MDVALSLHINTPPSQLIPDQLPTPPTSEPHSPTLSPSVPQRRENVDDDLTVSISRTFDPHSELLPPQPDTIFSSADGVFFYVHRSVIREKSTNGWNGQLPHLPASTYSSDAGSSKVIALPEQAAVLNIVLHAVYGISCASYSPSIQDISAAVDAMEAYGISPKAHILPSTPLYVLILSHAPLAPLVAYTLAASHDILSLAVSISPLLLSYPLESLPEAAVQSMGAVYLKRLLLLHNDRLAAFRRLLPPSPLPHLPTASCQSAEHSSLSRAWTIAAAHLAWEASPDISSSAIEAEFSPLLKALSCLLCAESLAARVRQLIDEWSKVKRSI